MRLPAGSQSVCPSEIPYIPVASEIRGIKAICWARAPMAPGPAALRLRAVGRCCLIARRGCHSLPAPPSLCRV